MFSWVLPFSFVLKNGKRGMYTGRYLLDTRFRILGTVVNNKHGFVLYVGAFSVISTDLGEITGPSTSIIRRTAGRH